MYVTLGQHCDPTPEVPVLARQASNHVERTELSSALAIALYFAGALVAALGLGLIAAYGWVLAGGAIAGFGLVVGTIGNSRWPGEGVSSFALLMGYVDVAQRWRSATDSSKTLRRLGRLVGLVLAGMAAAVSIASARSLSDHASVYARIATAATHAGAAAMPAAAHVLGGTTSQGWPVGAEIAKTGTRITLVETGLEMSCSSGARFPLPVSWFRLPISAGGKVRAAAPIPPSTGALVSLTGGSESLTGRVNRRRSTLSGLWQLHLTFKISDGQTVQCDSGRVTFTAKL